MRPVDRVNVTSAIFRRVHLHRNNRYYRFLMNVCELLHDARLPEQKDGKVRFRDFIRDERTLPRLFENFVKYQFTIAGHKIRVVSVDLDHPWKKIRRRLLGLLS